MAADGGEVIVCYIDDVWNEKLEDAKKSKKLIVIYFTASWCPPCCLIDDFVAETAKQFPNAVFFEVNVDLLPNVVLEFAVNKLPTFILMKEDKILDKVVRTRVVGAAKDDYRLEAREIAQTAKDEINHRQASYLDVAFAFSLISILCFR